MASRIDKEIERLIEKKILERFEADKTEDVREALYAVADDLRANGYPNITDQAVYRVYVAVMTY